jgi:hypothetical protein
MVAGITFSIRVSMLEIWLGIPLPDKSFFVQNIEQGLPDGLGGLPAIFAHPDEGGPVSRPKQHINDKPG